jgi:hypothetical protein
MEIIHLNCIGFSTLCPSSNPNVSQVSNIVMRIKLYCVSQDLKDRRKKFRKMVFDGHENHSWAV